jgi:phenylalanyl-tRNA synthetase alpha chain
MLQDIDRHIEDVKNFRAENRQELEQFRIRYLGKRGILNDLFRLFRDISPDKRRETGRRINDLKQLVTDTFDELSGSFSGTGESEQLRDLTLPGPPVRSGARHPISIVRNQIIDIFSRQGFTISEGPEIEDDWHVFSALNFPPEHPARDMQDTFFISRNPDVLLRTHTSSVQVRVMEREKPPIRTISPGRVFRNEAISARAHCIFHQVEGLYIDENVSFADLKQILLYFVHEMFGSEVSIRLRPSYFPFTEPSAEMDVSCRLCGGNGCNVCKHTGWLEIMGCGMVDPNVLSFNGIDPLKYTGYAFGMGIERIAMLKYQVRDLRLYFENDIRFLDQFSTAY